MSESTLKKSDPKFKVYLGLARSESDPPAGHATSPPTLTPVFQRETWLTPGAEVELYRLQARVPGAPAPWWAGFGAKLANTPTTARLGASWAAPSLVQALAALRAALLAPPALVGRWCRGSVGGAASLGGTGAGARAAKGGSGTAAPAQVAVLVDH